MHRPPTPARLREAPTPAPPRPPLRGRRRPSPKFPPSSRRRSQELGPGTRAGQRHAGRAARHALGGMGRRPRAGARRAAAGALLDRAGRIRPRRARRARRPLLAGPRRRRRMVPPHRARLPVEAIPAAHVPSILTAAGTVSAFGTVYAAHALYGFIGPAAAFVLLGVIGIATMLAAALHGPALAGLGLAGSLVVPLLVSSQRAEPVAARALSRRRRRGGLRAGPAAPLAVARGGGGRGRVPLGPRPDRWPSRRPAPATGRRPCSCIRRCSWRWPPPSWRSSRILPRADDEATPDWIATACPGGPVAAGRPGARRRAASTRSGPCLPSPPWPSWR